MGSLYKQKNSRIFWIKYYAHGKAIRETTGTEDRDQAKDILKVREGQVGQGR